MHNPGIAVVEYLTISGICTSEELIDTGNKQAFIRIKSIFNSEILNKLCTLEGTIQGIRWHYLSKD